MMKEWQGILKEYVDKPANKNTVFSHIKCYPNPNRREEEMIAEFASYSEAKRFIGLSNVGTRIEEAAANCTPVKDYYWKVNDATKEQCSEIAQCLKERYKKNRKLK